MREIISVSKGSNLRKLVEESVPFKITGYDKEDLGPCLEEWIPDRLREILKDCRVSVHVSKENSLNFVSKNFEYEYMTLSEMLDRIAEAQRSPEGPREYLYYRSLGSRPRKDPATLSSVHPYLEETFTLPKEVAEVLEDSLVHSTVFRISQPGVELWTHYDALDNFLVQIQGSKFILLFPPSVLHKLSITDTSSPYSNVCKVDMNKENYDLISAYQEAYRAILNPGDILFIPSAWSHGVHSLEDKGDSRGVKVSVSVNLFVLNNEIKYFSKNIYGNEDPIPMKRACDLLQNDFLKLSQQLPVHLQKAFWSKIAAISLNYLNRL